jgi:predicted amidophosphoribosyltransferase
MRRLLSAWMDALMPPIPVCLCCGVEKDVVDGLCPRCTAALNAQVAGAVQARAYPGCAAYRYDGAARRIVVRYKFGGRKWTAPFLADRMAAALARILAAERPLTNTVSDDINGVSDDRSPQSKGKEIKVKETETNNTYARVCFDVICHVPLHKGRRRSRGYDQAQVLAQCLSERLHIPSAAALTRVRRTQPQTRLNAARRIDNIRGAFAATDKVHGRVLLVDDVLTTGATASECADVLVKAGADSVFVLTFARALCGEDFKL